MRARYSMWFIMAFLMQGMSGCSNPAALEAGPSSALLSLPREIVLNYGDNVQLEGTVLRLNFGRVLEDSRCPVDVTCVWAGNAKVEIGIGAGMGPTHPLHLNTNAGPRAVTWSGIRVTLLEVTPSPHSENPIPLEDYSVTLSLEPLG